MPNRRDFILQAAVGGGALAFGGPRATHARENTSATPLRVLILGGTGFIGPHFVRAALERGHKVSVFLFSGDKERPDLPAGVEPLVGDRNGDLQSIETRDWDAVLDLATYVPNWVRTLGEALRGRVKHYTFISTIMTYRFPGATDEQSKLEVYTGSEDPYSLTGPGKYYGALKVLCEREGEKQFPGRALALRPGTIVGPREKQGLFTYWAARFERGGEIVAAGDPFTQVQLIDVRDLAEWAVRLAERGQTGAFTTVGPAAPLSWSEMLGGIRAAFSVPTKLTWIPLAWLRERGLEYYSSLLFWPSQMGIPGLTEMNVQKAVDYGLTFRPLNATVADTLAGYKSLPPAQRKDALVRFDQNNKTLDDSMTRERDVLSAWSTSKARTSDSR